MDTTHKIADAVGRARMSAALGVGATAVSNAIVAGKFPPSWFLVLQFLCKESGINCPPDLFGMKSTAGEVPVNAKRIMQGQAAHSTTGGVA